MVNGSAVAGRRTVIFKSTSRYGNSASAQSADCASVSSAAITAEFYLICYCKDVYKRQQLNYAATSGGDDKLVNCFIPENIFYRLAMKNLIKLEMKTLYYHFTDLNKKELP